MTIEFNKTTDALVTFYKFDRWYSDERKVFRIKTRIYWAMIATIPFWLVVFNLNKITSLAGLTFYGLFLFSLGFLGAKRLYLGKIEGLANKVINDKTNEDFIGPTTMEFLDNSFRWTTKNSNGESQIESIKKIKDDKDYYYLYNTSLTAFVIPKTAFRTLDDLNYFINVFRRHSTTDNRD
jgi:hypothetical protein